MKNNERLLSSIEERLAQAIKVRESNSLTKNIPISDFEDRLFLILLIVLPRILSCSREEIDLFYKESLISKSLTIHPNVTILVDVAKSVMDKSSNTIDSDNLKMIIRVLQGYLSIAEKYRRLLENK